MDEAQYAVHRSLLKVKTFFDPDIQSQYEKDIEAWKSAGSDKKTKPKNPFEVQAEKWIEENPTEGQYSDIGHTDSGVYYVTLPNILSKTIVEGIEEAVAKFDLNVPLGISWITGSTWAQCH